MSEDGSDPDRDEAVTPQAGVLGNLPRSRPTVRSPRRAAAEPESAPVAKVSPTAEGPDPERERASSSAELEALARGGLAIAGGAATFGLRIAGRAAAAVRATVERG